jgi:hypothetical protein
MITVRINRKNYKGISEWSEMPCSMASKLFAVPMPEKLKEYYKVLLDGKEDKINSFVETVTNEDFIRTFPEYYGQIIEIWFNCNVEKLKPTDRTEIYGEHCMKFILGLHWTPNIPVEYLEYIELDGLKLFAPRFKDVLGVQVPICDETAETFAEVADLQINCEKFKGGQYDVAPNIISIFYRPKGEVYDEDTSLERAKRLGDVKMDVVWQVFFCLIQYLASQRIHDLLSLVEAERLNRKPLQKVRDYLKSVGMGLSLTFRRNMEALTTLKT